MLTQKAPKRLNIQGNIFKGKTGPIIRPRDIAGARRVIPNPSTLGAQSKNLAKRRMAVLKQAAGAVGAKYIGGVLYLTGLLGVDARLNSK